MNDHIIAAITSHNMAENRFHQHRHELDLISKTEGVDVSVAMSILSHNNSWTGTDAEAAAFHAFLLYIEPKNWIDYFTGEVPVYD